MDYKENYFNDTILIRVSVGIVGILKDDACYYHYIKNNQPNVSGFLNLLLPILSDNRNELHTTFLKYNNNEEELCRIIEKNLYGIYLPVFTTEEDSYKTLSLRVTKANYNKFRIMHDTQPQKYDMDFTNYLRSLLNEYAAKRFYQRELIIKQDIVTKIKQAIDESRFCKIYTEHLANAPSKKGDFCLVPITLAINPVTDEVYVAGKDETGYYVIPLVCVTSLIVSDEVLNLEDDDYSSMKSCIDNFFDNLIKNEDEEENE